MLNRKKVLALAGIVCVFAVCLTVITVEGAWDGTLEGFLDDWDSLRHKVWQSGYTSWHTYYLTGNTHGWANIREALDDIKDEVNVIFESTALKVDYETLEIEILTIAYDTDTDLYPLHYYDTEVGRIDRASDVYVLVTWRGQMVDATVTATIRDGGKYAWWSNVYTMDTGLYDVYVDVPTGVAVGSYLVEVEATINILGKDFYGTATYTIDCWATTT